MRTLAASFICLFAVSAQAADLVAVDLAPGERALEVATRLRSGGRWLGLGNTLVIELPRDASVQALGRPARRLDYPAGSELTLVLSKHATAPLPEPLEGKVLARHSGLTLAALTATSRKDLDDPHVELRPVPWNQVLSETLSGRVAKGPPDAAISALLSAVTPEGIRADIQKLMDFKSRHTLSASYKEAVAWTEGELARAGLTTRRESFSISGRTAENVIGEIPGQPGVSDVYVVGAHLDSISFSGGVNNAPGADDNGSGSACTLAIARALAGQKPRATIRFILFGGEEEGLIGSKAYVRGLPAAERARIKGALIMDMTAFRKGVPGVTLEGKEVSRPLSDIAADVTARYTTLKIERSFEAWGSDHVPFLEAQIPTLLTIELDYPNNGNEHGPRDTMALIDADQAAAIARADLAILATLNGLGTRTSR